MNKQVIILFITALFLIPVSSADARSGCCSHHGGVCGCECCDGTSLSSTCAPYYPSCNNTSIYTAPVYLPPPTPTCPTNSIYNSVNKSCSCNVGYYPDFTEKYCVPEHASIMLNDDGSFECELGYYKSFSGTTCLELPDNAYPIFDKTTPGELWKCDVGYTKQQEKCVLDCDQNIKTKVVSVVDGDTIKIECNSNIESVRIIGIDTPETVHPEKPVQCFGKEASDKLKMLIEAKEIYITKGEGSNNRDKYDRLLRYIYLDNEDIGASMIKDGYAFSYKLYPHQKLDDYNQLEFKAKEQNLGLWSSSTCSYNVESIKSSGSWIFRIGEYIKAIKREIEILLYKAKSSNNIKSTKITGTIEGSLSYPSEGIPTNMEVCAETIESKNVYCTKVHLFDQKYTYNEGYKLELPVGKYTVYSKTNITDDVKGYKAYYSECNGTVCESHTPIIVKVESNKTNNNIDPIDWYNF